MWTIARIDAGTGGLEVDDRGDIFMGDFGAYLSGPTPGAHVFRVTPDGQVEVFADGQVGASGNALDASGNLLQSSIAGGFVSRISPGGTSTEAAAGLSAPVGIAVDDDGTFYVANCGNQSVTATDPDGTTTVFASSELLQCPNGIALASDGNLYVANFSSRELVRVLPSGDVELFVTLPSANLGHVTYANGRLYVALRGAHQLAEVTLAGEVDILVGTGERGRRDGAIETATLSFPNDIALSPDGRVLYFNDVAPRTTDPNEIRPTLLRAVSLPIDDQ